MGSSSGKKLGQRIKEFRLGMGWTQEQLANNLKVSKPTVVRLESGKNCRDLTRAKIERFLSANQAIVAA